jgi:hypothetical protein
VSITLRENVSTLIASRIWTTAGLVLYASVIIQAGQYFSQGRQGEHRFFRDWVTGKGTLDEDQWAWEELFAFVSLARIRP